VAVHGDRPIVFRGHHATVSDSVAEALVGMMPSFYSVEADLNAPGALGSVLVVRDMGMGDVLMATPLVRHLARRGAAVDVQTNKGQFPVFDHNPHVRALYAYDPAPGDPAPDHGAYDAVIDLVLLVENEEASERHGNRVAAFGRAADVDLPPGEDRRLDLFLTDAERAHARARLAARCPGAGPLVGYVYASSTDNRNWTPGQHRTALAALWGAGYRVVVVHHQDPAPRPFESPGVWWATGPGPLRDAFALLACCDVVVSPDTGLFHAASALGVPVVAAFGPMALEDRATHAKLTVLNDPAGCALFPCRRYTCLNRRPDGLPRCLSVGGERVAAAVARALTLGGPNTLTDRDHVDL
jgi:ADP-heptose:LPS heptosyltransferase